MSDQDLLELAAIALSVHPWWGPAGYWDAVNALVAEVPGLLRTRAYRAVQQAHGLIAAGHIR